MNNSQIADILEEDEVDISSTLRKRQTELVTIIEAIQLITEIDEWKALKELVFDGLVERLEKNLQVEVKKNELNAPEIYRLNGQLTWAKRYSDLRKLAETYKVELTSITKKLNDNA